MKREVETSRDQRALAWIALTANLLALALLLAGESESRGSIIGAVVIVTPVWLVGLTLAVRATFGSKSRGRGGLRAVAWTAFVVSWIVGLGILMRVFGPAC
jgi:hypothetical protein